MGNGYHQSHDERVYIDQSEKILSEYLLAYKGKDNSGLDMQDAVLMTLVDNCGEDVMLETSNIGIEASISGWANDSIRMVIMTSSNMTCTNAQAYYFEIYPQTGKIISKSDPYDENKILLNFLDNFD